MSAIVFHHGDYQETIYTAAVSHFSVFPRDLLLQLYFRDMSLTEVKFSDEKEMDDCLRVIPDAFRKDLNARYGFDCKEVR